MGKRKKPDNRVYVDAAGDRVDIKSRLDCTANVTEMAPSSPVFQANAPLRDSHARLIACGAALATADGKRTTIIQALSNADDVVNQKKAEFDLEHGVFIALAGRYCTKSEEVSGLGLREQTRNTYTLIVPTNVDAKYEAKTATIRIRVTEGPGSAACIIEISPTPKDPASYKRLPGIGTVQVLTGYSPGTYGVRAASARAGEETEFTTPVEVVVK